MNALSQARLRRFLKKPAGEKCDTVWYFARRGLERLGMAELHREGAELEVFRGAERLRGKLRPLILCEVLDGVTAPWGYPARAMVARLRECDYDWYDFRPDGGLVAHAPRQDYPEVRNYLAVPREKRSSIAPWIHPVEEGVRA